MKDSIQTFWQFVRFSMVGALNTLIDFAVFSALTLAPFFAALPVFAHGISYSVGVVCSLTLNKLFTFRYKGKLGGARLAAFLGINLAALAVSSLVLAWIEWTWALHPMIAKALTLPVSLSINFVGNKVFVFNREKQ